MQTLLLQKPDPKNKTQDHNKHLQRRLEMWINRDIRELFTKGRFLQDCLPLQTSKDNFEDISRKFCELLSMQGQDKISP